jgi:antitoxin HigA-1
MLISLNAPATRMSRSDQPPHPGAIFTALLAQHAITAYRCARDIGVTSRHTYDLASCRRSVTPILALKLARYFGNDPSAWMRLQTEHDLAIAQEGHLQELQSIRPLDERHASP